MLPACGWLASTCDPPFPVTPLELEYSPSSRVASLDAEVARYRTASDEAIKLPHQVLPTGDSTDEFAVVFDVADGPAQRVHIFIHGGYWQALSAWDSLAPAPVCVRAGIAFAAVNYTLAPAATIETMIDQCTRAVEVIEQRFPTVIVTLSGSSAGAHLAAHVACRRPDLVDRLLLASGVYDLTPLLGTYVNEALGLNLDRAAALSLLGPRPSELSHAQVLLVHGDNETDSFKAQSARFAAAWAAPVVEVVGRHHFDLVFDLAAIDQHPSLWSRKPARVAAQEAGAGGQSEPSDGRRVAPARVAAGSLKRIATP
ncbi:MAG: esterase [Ilumatobacteraceae bacterium]|nr:esterase [Ilumatobacteraceae bacterium]